MAQRVGERLLHHPVGRARRLDRQRQALLQPDERQLQRDVAVAAARGVDQLGQRVSQPEVVERRRRQPRDQAVHRLVEPRGLVGDHLGGLRAGGVALAQAGLDRARQRADRGDRLRELVVQLARDGAALGLGVLLQAAGELAALLQRALGLEGAQAGLDLGLDRLGELIDGLADHRRLAPGQRRQARAVVALLEPAQSGDDGRQRPQRRARRPRTPPG